MNKFLLSILLLLFFLLCSQSSIAQGKTLEGTVRASISKRSISDAEVFIKELEKTLRTDQQGQFQFKGLEAGQYELIVFAEGYSTRFVPINMNQALISVEISLDSLELNLEAIEVEARRREEFGIRRLNNVEGMAIYAAKKSEVIDLENLVANLATNNPRQIYKNIAGLNIWESDGAGLQLSIGARGLDPNRTANFNTRQNGYDISADALGYPESYYTPPTQALRRIEIVRGAASLQYGPQFGGLLNFVLKKGDPKKALAFTTQNTIGSIGLFNSFTSLGGSKKGWRYYGYFQHKQGNGWRENSGFEQNGAYLSAEKTLKKWTFRFDYTRMNYLAQQPGGLEDFEFLTTPRLSKRARNWFKVDWNLASLTVDYRLSDKTKINNRSFFLDASREALGALNPINRPDGLGNRDLNSGRYTNFGNETRLIHRYKIGSQLTTFLAGMRYYQGLTRNRQGEGNDQAGPDFEFLNPNDLEQSDYEFPSRNFSLFAENLFYLNSKLSITPGLRWEYIKTASDGYFKERVFSGDSLLLEIKTDQQKESKRSFLLTGLGAGYKIKEQVEAYANFSQNYRSINFSDLAVVNPNLIIDSTLTDEKGYNLDLGLRGNLWKEAVQVDFSLFYLNYKNRIGTTEIIINDPILIEKAVAYTTNIGNAFVFGLESYVEVALLSLFNKKDSPWRANLFVNLSLLNSAYATDDQKIDGNAVELVPPFSLKTGLSLGYKKFKMAYQFAHVGAHFTDATNAIQVADATRGRIPSYQVQDLSFSYSYRWFNLQAGINNLTDSRYFTRRAVAYPGPGIIPSDGRNFYLTLGLKL